MTSVFAFGRTLVISKISKSGEARLFCRNIQSQIAVACHNNLYFFSVLRPLSRAGSPWWDGVLANLICGPNISAEAPTVPTPGKGEQEPASRYRVLLGQNGSHGWLNFKGLEEGSSLCLKGEENWWWALMISTTCGQLCTNGHLHFSGQ